MHYGVVGIEDFCYDVSSFTVPIVIHHERVAQDRLKKLEEFARAYIMHDAYIGNHGGAEGFDAYNARVDRLRAAFDKLPRDLFDEYERESNILYADFPTPGNQNTARNTGGNGPVYNAAHGVSEDQEGSGSGTGY